MADGARTTESGAAADLKTLLAESRALAEEGFLERHPRLPSVQPALTGKTFGAHTLVAPLGRGGGKQLLLTPFDRFDIVPDTNHQE